MLKDCIEVQEKKKKVAILCSRLPQNVKLGILHDSHAVTAKKCTKKRDAVAEFFVLPFLTYRKIPKISPGAYIFQRPILSGLYSEWLMYGGKFAFKIY